MPVAFVLALLLTVSNVPCQETDPGAQPPATPPENVPGQQPVSAASRFQVLTTEAAQVAIKLTSEQTAQITKLLSDLKGSLESADDAGKRRLVEEADQKILAVLNQSQRIAFSRLFPEKKLKFSFRFAKWDNVLQWVADEADLSLVMDAPPPGTFNYTDSKQFSPTAAVDLLNGWLLTKGFTLVQRDRLLMVIDLSQGTPAGAIPQIPAEQLPLRGNFEFVTVLFPLEGRLPESVSTEVAPFLSAYGQSENLPQTSQMMVTDVAGNLIKIDKLIQSIPLPKTKPKPPTPQPTPKPVLETYAIKHANAEKVAEVIEQFVSGTVFVDPVASQISINAPPADQARAKQIIEQLESNQGPNQQNTMELYPVQPGDNAELLATLQLIAPNGQYRIDTPSRKLLAWASPADHQKIETVLSKLTVEGGNRVPAQLQVYSVAELDSDSLQTLLSELLPTARTTIDSRSQSLVVIGSVSDHLAVKSLLEQLKTTEPTLKRLLVTYSAAPAIRSQIITVLEQIVPRAEVVSGGDEQQLIVLATAEEQQLVKESLDRLTTELKPEAERVLQSYNIDDANSALAIELLGKIVPAAEVTADAANQRLVVMASEGDHSTIEKTLELLNSEAGAEAPSIRSYAYSNGDITTAGSLVSSLVPAATITPEPESRRLIAIAPASAHAMIEQIMTELEREGSAQDKQVLTYQLGAGMTAESITPLLLSLVPGATVSPNESDGRIVVIASTADHALVAQAMKVIAPPDGQSLPELRFYVTHVDEIADTVEILRALVPKAQITADSDSGRLSVVAIAADHQSLEATLKKLDAARVSSEPLELKVHPVSASQKTRFTAIATSLGSRLTGMKVLTDAEPRELAIWATPSQQTLVTEILSQLKQELPADQKPVLVSYPILKLDAESVAESLGEFFPDTKMKVDARSNRVLIWASQAEHETLKKTIAQLDSDVPEQIEIKLMAYPVRSVDLSVATELLQQELPELSIVADANSKSLIIRGRLKEHQKAAAIIEALNVAAGQATVRSAVVYPFTGSNITTIRELLIEAYPDSRIVADTEKARILVWAKAEDQNLIRKTITEMQGDPESAAILETYAYGDQDPAAVLELLQRVVPEAFLTINSDQKRILSWASSDDQEKIRSVVQGVAGAADTMPPRTMRVFDIDGMADDTAVKVLSAVVPEIEFITSADAKRMIAWVDQEQAKLIEATLSTINAEMKPASNRQLRIYPLVAIDPDVATSVLTSAVPEVTFSSFADGKTIAAWTLDIEDKQIQSTLKELESAASNAERGTLATYSIHHLGPNVATAITNAVPDAIVIPGADPSQLIVKAKSSDHEQVQQLLDQLQSTRSIPAAKELAVFDIKGTSSEAVLEILAPLADADVQFTVDEDGNRLFVRARADQQRTVRSLLEKVTSSLPARGALTTKVYTFENPDADEVQSALKQLLPQAELVVDSDERLLVATATEGEQQTIQRIVDEVTTAAASGNKMSAKVYPLEKAEPQQVLAALEDMYSRRECQLSIDEKRRVLLTVATPEIHEQIDALLKQLNTLAADTPDRTVQFYSMANLDSEAAERVVQELLKRMDRDATVVADSRGQQLIVEANTLAQAAVEATIGKLGQSEPREIEVFQLTLTDAVTAELAVMNLFESLSDNPGDSPQIQADTDTQQLLVRGTKAQIAEIRGLLIKMGETTLADVVTGPGRGNLRQVPLPGDPQQTLEQIERLWPRLRSNPIQIMRPEERLRKLQPDRSPDPQPSPDAADANPGSQFSVTDEVTQQQPPIAAGDQAPTKPRSQIDQDQPPVDADSDRDSKNAPIVIVPGANGLTIASEDTEALDQFEQLLRLLRQQTGRPANSEFTVYALRNAASSDVANTLEKLFDDPKSGAKLATGEVLIVPDQRLNALIVHANRIDRARLEPLIETLDSSNAPETLTAYQTQVVPIRSADAKAVEDVLSGIYKAEMTAGGARSSISIPKGVPAEVASVLRQINASASSPLITIEVEETTNSLVIKAPKNLMVDVVELVKELDEAVATSNSRSLRIIPLRKTNASQMLKTLNQVLD